MKLSPEDHERRIQVVGEIRRDMLERKFGSQNWDRLSDERRIERISDSLRRATEIGNKRFIREMKEKHADYLKKHKKLPDPAFQDIMRNLPSTN